ncbi:MAG: O-antigen ligase family protein [Pseudomonadota bacterium]
MQTKSINFRLVLVCIAAAATGLPIAIVSIAKLLLLLGASGILLISSRLATPLALNGRLHRTRFLILVAMLAFALSIFWTAAPLPEALGSLGKYSKLLFIPLVVAFIQSRREALFALSTFAVVQLFVVISSWMLFFHIPVPWATSPTAVLYNSVFSSYLDEGIMTAVFAAICWHLRKLVPGRFGSLIAMVITLLALLNVFFVLRGRTGHVVALALISLAIVWELPHRYRNVIALVPVIVLAVVVVVSPKVQNRIIDVKSEVMGFFSGQGVNVVYGTSSGIRLHFWHRAIQSIAENPLLGAGSGSWTDEFNRLEKLKSRSPELVTNVGNPHQEYLLWGVQLGVGGIILLLAILVSIFKETLAMDELARRSAQSTLVALAIACLFNSTIYDALIGDFFCITLALLMALGLPVSKSAATTPQPERAT